MAELRGLFLAEGVEPSAVDALDLQDRIDGHCETCAAALSEQVLAQLELGAVPPEEALAAGTAAMLGALDASTTAEQVALLFGPEARMMRRAPAGASGRPARFMWSSAARVDDVLPPAASDFLTAMLAGATPGLPHTLRRMAEHTTAQRFAVPLYVLNYIWDGDELTPKQMRDEHHETACYSIHAVGLVFDTPSKTVSLADPNGAMMLGGGMELVCVPHAKLPKGWAPTTAISQYDREQDPGAWPEPVDEPPKKKAKKGGKKKK